MAESLVEFLLNQLSQVLIEEINLQRGVKLEIQLIKDELQSISAFLRVADAEEENDPRLAVWVKQVRELAFDIEDILDEFSLCFVDTHQSRSTCFKCLHKIASPYKKWKINHLTGSELQSIKTRVKEIYERHQRYPSLLDGGSSSTITTMEAVNQFRRNALLQDEIQLVGTEEPKQELIHWLLKDDSHLRVVAITGMGGLGKTTLAQQIYNNDKVKAWFQRKALVTVSQSLKQEELFRELIRQLSPTQLPGEIDAMDSFRLKERMKELLQNERYLIVLYDVWKIEDWDQLKVAMPRNIHGSRVIITTRISEVASFSTTEYQEGFVNEKDGRILEEVAESYFYELLNRNLIQTVTTTYDGRVKSCCIHDFLREAILSKSKDENFIQVLSKENATNFPEGARRLSILHLSHQVGIYQSLSSLLSKLRSLLFFESDRSLTRSKLSKLLSGDFKLLKVLDLEGASLDTCPKQVSRLFLLRYLSLKHTGVFELDKSIGNLHNLETLDLRYTHVAKLPSEIYKLHKLRYLLIHSLLYGREDYYHLIKFQKSGVHSVEKRQYISNGLKASAKIGGLVSLHELCYVDASEAEDDMIIELGRLVQLRRLCLIHVKEHHGRALCSSISKMQCLSSLTLLWSRSERIDLQGLSSPPPLLKRLHLTGCLVELPSWVSSLQYLEVLHLMDSNMKEDPLKSLNSLASLIELLLDDAFLGEVIFIPPGGFPRLKFLGISGYKTLLISPSAIPGLESVYLSSFCMDFKDIQPYDRREGYIDDGVTVARWLPEEKWYRYTEKEFGHIVKVRA